MSIRKWLLGLAVIASYLVAWEPALVRAAVINADDHPAIAGTLHTNAILDEETNRLWLDITETLGLSFNEVSSMLDSGEEYEGWLLPGLSDLEELLGNANIPYPTAPPGYDLAHQPGFNQAISDFLDIYGSPSGTDLGDQAEIWVNNPFGRIVLSDGEYGNLDGHRARLMVNPVDTADRAFATVGTALYRPVPAPVPEPIPEPASLAVWSVLGLVGIGVTWRRRRRKGA